jgi:hypothetical protein
VPIVVPSQLHDTTMAHFSADLTRVVDAWPALPAPIKTAILALVEASGGSDA